MDVLSNLTDYFQKLEKSLNCPRAYRRMFLNDAHRMAEDFLQGNPAASSDEVILFLGSPTELAQSLISTIDPDLLLRFRIRRRYIKRTAFYITIAFIILFIAFVIRLWQQPTDVEISHTLIIYETEDKS